MRYSFDFTIPAATAASAKYEDVIVLDVGVIKQILIRFKAGCHNRVFVAVFDSLEQIAPAKSTQAIYGDYKTFAIPMNYPLNEPPYTLIFKGWSPDTRYNHLISIWIDVLAEPKERGKGLVENLTHLLKGGL